jgi:hypothetical protein
LRLLVVLAASLDVDPVRVGVACLLDDGGFAGAYGVRGGDGVVVRPDGYLGLVAHPLTVERLADHLRCVAGATDVARREPLREPTS